MRRGDLTARRRDCAPGRGGCQRGASRTCKTSLPPLLLPIETGRRRAKVTRAKCVACGERFSGPRDNAFRWLMFHGVLHQLEIRAVQRFTEGSASATALLAH